MGRSRQREKNPICLAGLKTLKKSHHSDSLRDSSRISWLDYASIVVYQAKELEKIPVSQINTRAFFIPQVYNKSLYKFKVMAQRKELNYFSSQ